MCSVSTETLIAFIIVEMELTHIHELCSVSGAGQKMKV
jgi:hypothetical protein